MMRNPYVSIFSTQNLTEKTNELTTLWELFVTNSFSENLSAQMRQSVLDSWNRCLSAGVNPAQLQTNTALAENDVKQILDNNSMTAEKIMQCQFVENKGSAYLDQLVTFIEGKTEGKTKCKEYKLAKTFIDCAKKESERLSHGRS
jgi:hypothetical protein